MEIEVTTTYLEMTRPSDLRPGQLYAKDGARLDVVRAEIPCPDLNRFFYVAVGSRWSWHDRLSWSYERWLQHLSRAELETWVGSIRGTPAGYVELERQGDDVEVSYFGLLPSFVGQGIGGALLTAAVERAWGMGAQRVWVHTCDLDHPAAVKNYEARGFRAYRTEKKIERIPEVISNVMLRPQTPTGDSMKIVMVYEVAADGTAKARENFAAHRARLDEFHTRGVLLMAGPYANPTEGALGIFTNREAAEEFVKGDPFVLNGVVAKWSLREWNEVLT